MLQGFFFFRLGIFITVNVLPWAGPPPWPRGEVVSSIQKTVRTGACWLRFSRESGVSPSSPVPLAGQRTAIVMNVKPLQSPTLGKTAACLASALSLAVSSQ